MEYSTPPSPPPQQCMCCTAVMCVCVCVCAVCDTPLFATAAADLESIRKRLDGPTVHYNSKDMLYDDLVLMCRNAMLYNDTGTVYYRYATSVSCDTWSTVMNGEVMEREEES